MCGLEWSPQASQLASGGNDNVLNVWEVLPNTHGAMHCRYVMYDI